MTADAPKARVLIVDDVPANLVALEAQLESLECEIVRAQSGNEALKRLLDGGYAVMLLDVQMPGMDGYEVARYAREHPETKDVPIIFLTAMLETEADVLRGYGTGAVDFLYKPINAHILVSKVRVFLELYASKRRLADEVAAHERTMADLEAFNYSVSHDLRAPLRPIAGFSQILLEDHAADMDPKARDYLERMHQAAVRMTQLIDDMLRLSRIRRSSVERRRVDLAVLAESIMADLRRNDPGREVEFVSAPTQAFGDSMLLRIALENLLRNAWKFTRKNPRARIELGTRQEGGETIHFVRDDGAGFDPSLSKKLFKPFQRLHSDADFEGTGIGLAIVDQIVRSHGGRLWAESTPGRGATFSFTL
jgi:signal transduction histidine kinase